MRAPHHYTSLPLLRSITRPLFHRFFFFKSILLRANSSSSSSGSGSRSTHTHTRNILAYTVSLLFLPLARSSAQAISLAYNYFSRALSFVPRSASPNILTLLLSLLSPSLSLSLSLSLILRLSLSFFLAPSSNLISACLPPCRILFLIISEREKERERGGESKSRREREERKNEGGMRKRRAFAKSGRRRSENEKGGLASVTKCRAGGVEYRRALQPLCSSLPPPLSLSLSLSHSPALLSLLDATLIAGDSLSANTRRYEYIYIYPGAHAHVRLF